MADHGLDLTGIEVDGRNIRNVTDAFRLFPAIATRALERHGIGHSRPDGTIDVKEDAWYPLDAWLLVFDDILEQVGPGKLLQMGTLVPEYAVFPPHIEDVATALKLCDVAYHLNHRKNGEIMFDEKTGHIVDGIGHYRCELRGERQAVIVSDAPYPCDFDRGIIMGIGKRFGGRPRMVHVGDGCRKTGAPACKYDVVW